MFGVANGLLLHGFETFSTPQQVAETIRTCGNRFPTDIGTHFGVELETRGRTPRGESPNIQALMDSVKEDYAKGIHSMVLISFNQLVWWGYGNGVARGATGLHFITYVYRNGKDVFMDPWNGRRGPKIQDARNPENGQAMTRVLDDEGNYIPQRDEYGNILKDNRGRTLYEQEPHNVCITDNNGGRIIYVKPIS